MQQTVHAATAGISSTIIDATAVARRIADNVANVIIGKNDVIEQALAALIADGHILVEDVPGVGKTMLARSLAVSIGGTFLAHPVHARPPAQRRYRGFRVQPGDGRF